MSYISCIVKGNGFQATKAASDRGIPFTFQTENKSQQTVGIVDVQFYEEIVAWFTETGNAPFPIGSLLFYTTHGK